LKKNYSKNIPPLQEYPLGQQWTPSEQQVALGNGQQPYPPDDNLQQVLPDGQLDTPSGHTTFGLVIKDVAGARFKAEIVSSPLVQKPTNKKY